MTNGIKSVGHFFWNFSQCPSINGLFCPISGLYSKNNLWNIKYMPEVIFFVCLFIPGFSTGDFEQKFSFMDGHSLAF